MIQKVQDTVIYLEVDEEQWEIIQGSKRQVERTGFLAQYLSGLRHRCSSYIDLAIMVPHRPETKRKEHLSV